MPASNRKFWENKIKRNKERDIEVTHEYKRLSWKVLRFWEHSVNEDIGKVIDKTINFIKQ